MHQCPEAENYRQNDDADREFDEVNGKVVKADHFNPSLKAALRALRSLARMCDRLACRALAPRYFSSSLRARSSAVSFITPPIKC